MFTLPIGMLKSKVVPSAPQFIGIGSAGLFGHSTNSVTIQNPTTIAGDVMLFFFWAESSTSQISSPAAGWFQSIWITPTLNSTAFEFYLYYKIAGSSEPSDYTWGLSGGSGYKCGVTLAYRPASAVQLDSTGSDNSAGNSTNTFTQSDMTTNHVDTTLVYSWGLLRSGSQSLSGIGSVSPMTQRLYTDYSSITRPDIGFVIADQYTTTAGPVGTRTLTTVDNNVYGSAIRCGVRASGT